MTYVCDECFREMEDDGSWEGILGSPEVAIRSSPLVFEHEDIEFPELAGVTFFATCPVARSDDIWLACSQNGTVI